MTNDNKMLINWFPGHMTKSLRMMEASIKQADCIIYVLDSRAPFSCLNPLFDDLFSGMPIIYVLNKADLGDVTAVREWTAYLSKEKNVALAIDSTTSKAASRITSLVRTMCQEKLDRAQRRGIKTTIRAMVIGVPNVGKSTLINNLCGKAKTATGNKPGVTRGKQWVRVNEYFELLDTPGTLYPKLSDEKVAKRLAYIGSIKDEVTDIFKLSCVFLEDINELDSSILKVRYKVDFEKDGLFTMEKIAKARGYLVKGGVPDVERAATMVLDDFRKGRLGRLTLDKVSEREM